jgi:hypothetical protein
VIQKIQIMNNTTNENSPKRIYITPELERVELDNEISLALESVNPNPAPGESMNNVPEYFNNDPFKTNVG